MKSISRNFLRPFRNGSRKLSTVSEESFVWPREREGNVTDVNWSLTGDGVVPVGDAFSNSRLPLLTTRLPVKVEGGKIELKEPIYTGDYKLEEAGEGGFSHSSFGEILESIQSHQSSGVDLFVEDAGVGAYAPSRVGVRVITVDPALALISRSLLITVPARAVDHRARFDGWKLDPRWDSPGVFMKWDGKKYNFEKSDTGKGQRPIVAFVGGDSKAVAVQFVENEKKAIVGANIVIGGKAPVSGLVDAVGHAATVLINNQQAESLAIPSASFTKDKSTCVVVGADEDVVSALYANKSLYGAYHNILTSVGVSAIWNGFIGTATAADADSVPSVFVGGKSAISLSPYNAVFPATHIAFYEKGQKTSSLSEDEAVKRIVALTEESKSDLIKSLLKGVKLSVVGSAADVSKIL